MYLKKLELHNQEQTMKLKRILCNILLSPIHLCNRDASSVMLAGSQAWDWGFLTHHALFIDQSNRVCKMRITQHEENRGEGTEGRWEEERRKDRGAKVTHCGRKTWRRGRNEKKNGKKEWHGGHFQIFISYFSELNPRIVLGAGEQWGGGNEYRTKSPDSFSRLARNLHLLNVSLVSWFVFRAQAERWAGNFRVLLRFVSGLCS